MQITESRELTESRKAKNRNQIKQNKKHRFKRYQAAEKAMNQPFS